MIGKNKTIIGLTGGFCSGKTTALKFFKSNGAMTISADDISAKILSADEIVKAKIYKKFGKSITKKQLADKIFANKRDRVWLEKLLHPKIILEAKKQIKKSKKRVIIFEAPILFEAKIQNMFNLTICIFADDKIRQKRALKRGFSRAEFTKRNKNQISLTKKSMMSDIIIDNNTNTKILKQKIKNLNKVLEEI